MATREQLPMNTWDTYETVDLARRLDYRGKGDWKNWTSRDFIVGDEDAAWGQNCKPKPLCGTMERNAINAAIRAGKSEVVETPADTPDAPWGVPGRYNQVIRITETDEAGDPEHYYFIVASFKRQAWTPSYGTGGYTTGYGYKPYTTPGVDAYEDIAGFDNCELCGKKIPLCACSDSDLIAAGICPMCGDDPVECTCPKDDLDVDYTEMLTDAEIDALLREEDDR
jgi:hypothetical protein